MKKIGKSLLVLLFLLLFPVSIFAETAIDTYSSKNYDVNNDLKIDSTDISELGNYYNNTSSTDNWDSYADINRDGIIDIFDMVKVSTKLGQPVKKFVICIDAGHGGKDSGAEGPEVEPTIGSTEVTEKSVNLPVALKVGEILSEDSNIEVIYTRDDDTYITLEERCNIANIAKSDYFISVHCNAYSDPTVNGVETFYCTGSTIGKILAQSIQTELVEALNIRDRGANDKEFYVLANTNPPAALIEIAFITNPTQKILLSTEEYQNMAASAIAKGIKNFLNTR